MEDRTMTEQLYLTDSQRREFDATVERVLDDRVVLDRTAFYPEGGGQPADTGTLRADGVSLTITDVQTRDTIYHHVDGETTGLEAGLAVTGSIDWPRRSGHMRHHTAQHLLSAILLEEFDAETTGNQLYADRARIDCAYDRFDRADLDTIETRLNEYIADDRPIETYQLDRATAEAELDTARTRIDLLPDAISEVRIVDIDGVDRTACAGTHVSSTGALGRATVTGRTTRGSGEERVSFELTDHT
jgi:misacylated tRNA(Ala) deacylase